MAYIVIRQYEKPKKKKCLPSGGTNKEKKVKKTKNKN